MQIIHEKAAPIRKDGGSIYVLLEQAFHEYLGVEKPDERGVMEDHDVKIGMGIGKHGKFLFLYSPSQQKKYQRELKKKELGD